MLKHIKLFEQYSINEKEILNSIYENWRGTLSKDLLSLLEGKIDESDYFEEEGELTPGERRALAREMQVISKPQLAALYLFALGKKEDSSLKYILRIPGMMDFIDNSSGKNTITHAAFADAIGLDSIVTASRTINKFKNLIDGVGETPGEIVYPKVIKAYEVFKNLNTDTLAAEAGEAIQDATISTKNREKASSMSAKSAVYREDEKKKAEKYGYMVYQFISSIRTSPVFRDLKKAQDFAINKISTESGVPTNKLLGYYETYLKSKGLLNNLYYAR
jgi:hypothetical protein